VIAFVKRMPLVHVNVPAGIVMVSPFNTWSCKPCTLAADPSD
jgi:hypothetical protein